MNPNPSRAVIEPDATRILAEFDAMIFARLPITIAMISAAGQSVRAYSELKQAKVAAADANARANRSDSTNPYL